MPDRLDPTPDEVNTADLGAPGHATPDSPAPSRTFASSDRPGDTIGPYKLLEMLGEGGFGEVWLAEQKEPIARRVALKLIKAGMDSKAVLARFEQERRALALMDHPNIARVHDAGTTSAGRPYFVMEHVKGAPITDYCDKARFTITQRLELFSKVCDAVQHAHMKGIIHRDLKPSNILVSVGAGSDKDKSGEARPVVIDFGVAKAVAARLTEQTIYTEQGQLIGTPEYMSPEQAEMAETDIDTRTDIYALGVILYELLTGALPFDPQTLRSAGYAAIQKIIREVDPPKPSTKLSGMRSEPGASATGRGGVQPSETVESNRGPLADARGSRVDAIAAARRTDLSSLARELKRELDWIPLKAMRKERTERYRTASELADDIGNYLAHRPLIAGPESAAYRVKKFVRRNRVGVVAGAAVFAALILGLAGTVWQARAAARERDAARLAQQSESEQRRLAEEQRDRAVKAEAETNERAKELKLVSDFQAGMLQQVDPTEAGVRLTRDVNDRFAEALKKSHVPEDQQKPRADAFRQEWLRVNATDTALALIDETILKPAVATLDREFKDQPIVDAQLRQTLADRYTDLGLYDAAYPLQESALATRRRVLGDEHPDTLTSINNMGSLLQLQGKLAEAEPYLREAIEKRRRVLGEEHPDTIASINNTGTLLRDQGRLAEAEPYLREALEKTRRVLGEDDPLTLSYANNVGALLYAQGKLAEAEPYLREALETKRRVLGEEHRDTLASINNMGSLLQAQGRLAEAEPYLREAMEKRRRVLGDDHPYTLNSINNVGAVLQAQGKLAEAEPYYREAMEKRRRLLGEEHPRTLVSINNMGFLLEAQGKFAEAESYLREALEKMRRVLGEEHPSTLFTISNLCVVLQDQDKLAEAEPYGREALETRQRVLGEEHPDTLVALYNFNNLLINLGRFAEAAPMVEECVEGSTHRLGPAHAQTRDALKQAVTLYESWDKAEPGKGYDAKAAAWKAKFDAINPPTPPNSDQATQAAPGGG